MGDTQSTLDTDVKDVIGQSVRSISEDKELDESLTPERCARLLPVLS